MEDGGGGKGMLPGIGSQDKCAVGTAEGTGEDRALEKIWHSIWAGRLVRGEDASADWSRQWGGGESRVWTWEGGAKVGITGGSSERSGLESENWEMGVTGCGDQSQNRNRRRRCLRPFLRPSGSPKTSGLDKTECAGQRPERGSLGESSPVRDVPQACTRSPWGGSGQAWDAGKSWDLPEGPAPSPAPGASFTHHRSRHLGSTCRRSDVSGSSVSLVTELNSARCCLPSVAPFVAVSGGAKKT